MSTNTLGRDSKTTATTPNGTRTLRILMPLGRSLTQMVSPTGSGSDATCLTPPTIESKRASVSVSLSTIDGDMPAALAFLMSSAFAAATSARRASSASATAPSTAFFSSVESRASETAAARALSPMPRMYSATSMVLLLCPFSSSFLFPVQSSTSQCRFRRTTQSPPSQP